jgi:two-component system CheB/CheR fusion protein
VKGRPVTRKVRMDGAGGERLVSLQVRPPAVDGGAGRFALVVFEDAPAIAGPDVAHLSAAEAQGSAAEGQAVAGLEEELLRTRDQLESTTVAHDQTVAELQTVNEELRSINEEQKAAGEELVTSREEIQSINEELTTINQEYQSTIDELKRTNADLQNLIESTEIGTIFLDRAMRIRRFTPAVSSFFNFVAADQGRSLADITHRLNYPQLVPDVRSVLTSLERIEREVDSDAGESYIVRINPYRSPDGGHDGVVLTFFDNTAQHLVEEQLREAKIVAESANLAKASSRRLSHGSLR